jgi:hypothetical protein
MPMQADEVRQKVLADHAVLRGMLSSLQQLAHQVLEGKHERTQALRFEGKTLLHTLREHMDWEDAHLDPVLRNAGSSGRQRADQLARDHREQRAMVEHLLAGLQDPARPTPILARSLLDLTRLLQLDMQDEEASYLDERALPDRGFGFDAEPG